MIDFNEYLGRYKRLVDSASIVSKLERLARDLEEHKAAGGRVLIFGNGASASIASHAALDFTKQGKLETLCFHDPALITAYSNDYGYENAFSQILQSYAQPNDWVFLISTSGESENLVKTARLAKEKNLFTVSFTGRQENNRLKCSTDEFFWVDSHAYNIVENCHSIWITSLIDSLVGKAEYEVK